MRLIIKLYKLALVYILTAKCYTLIFLLLLLFLISSFSAIDFMFYLHVLKKKINLVEILQRSISLGSKELSFT